MSSCRVFVVDLATPLAELHWVTLRHLNQSVGDHGITSIGFFTVTEVCELIEHWTLIDHLLASDSIPPKREFCISKNERATAIICCVTETLADGSLTGHILTGKKEHHLIWLLDPWHLGSRERVRPCQDAAVWIDIHCIQNKRAHCPQMNDLKHDTQISPL